MQRKPGLIWEFKEIIIGPCLRQDFHLFENCRSGMYVVVGGREVGDAPVRSARKGASPGLHFKTNGGRGQLQGEGYINCNVLEATREFRELSEAQ